MNVRNFFAALKRRNVYKVAVVCAAIAWLLIQIATQTFDSLSVDQFVVTDLAAEPPRLLLTVMFCGLDGQERRPLKLPPPLLVMVPISAFEEVT